MNTSEIKEIAKELYPDKRVYRIAEVARILGLSPQTLYNKKCCRKYSTINDIRRLIDEMQMRK